VDNAVDLLSVKLRETLLRHVVDEEVIADLGVSVDTLAVGLSDSLSEDTGIFGVEEEVDPGELGVLVETIPVAGVDFALHVIRVDEDWLPFTAAIFIFEKTLSGDGSEVAVHVVAEGDPLLR
jgi:hypothetical protein